MTYYQVSTKKCNHFEAVKSFDTIEEAKKFITRKYGFTEWVDSMELGALLQVKRKNVFIRELSM